MIYLDSSALVKLVREEDDSAALQTWLDERADHLQVTSELARAEVMRAVRRNNHTTDGELLDPAALETELSEASVVLAAVAQVVVDCDVLDQAGALSSPVMRTLDGIHLASADECLASDVEFVTYDRRLASAARQAGLMVVAPSDSAPGRAQPTIR